MKKVFLLASVIPVFALAAPRTKCLPDVTDAIAPEAREKVSLQFVKSFFERVEPVMATKEHAFTYSFDSEVSFKEALAFLYKHNDLEKKYRKDIFSNYNFTREELKSSLHVSDAQFERFVLRKGVNPAAKKFNLLDLNPAYAASLRTNKSIFLHTIKNDEEFVARLNKALGFTVENHPDGDNMEITHGSFQIGPQAFKNEVKSLHKQFMDPQTHLHLGIPEEACSTEELLVVAKGVETKVIIQSAAAGAEGEAAYAYSYLNTNVIGWEDRGFLNVKPSVFSKPTKSHDFEIREWVKVEQGQENLAVAVYLVEKKTKLKKVPVNEYQFPYRLNASQYKSNPASGDDTYDLVTVNLKGALGYAGYLLKVSGNPEKAKVGQGLLNLRDQITKETLEKLRPKIREFLNENDVDGLLTPDVFLQ